MGARIGPPEGGQPAQIAPANDPTPNLKRPLAGLFRRRMPPHAAQVVENTAESGGKSSIDLAHAPYPG